MTTRTLQGTEQLRQALQIEEAESRKLEVQLRECQNRFDSLQTSHTQLEHRYDSQQEQLGKIQTELKQLKKSKNEMETILSEELVHHMNEKEKWLDKESEYTEKISALKNALDAQTIKSKEQEQAISEAQAQVRASSAAAAAAANDPKLEKKSTKDLAAANKTIERLRGELDMVHQQMEMVSKEYALRHDTVKKEAEQLKGLNSRLQEENEGFQVLLAQKTVLGGFATLADELNSNTDDDETDEIKDQSSTSDPTSPNSKDDLKALKKRVYDLEFETRSLNNNNRALKLSLERLVQRLLEYREFEAVVHDEQKVPQRSLSLFHERVSHRPHASMSSNSPYSPQSHFQYPPSSHSQSYQPGSQSQSGPPPTPVKDTGGPGLGSGSQKLPRRRNCHAHSPSVQSVQSVSSMTSSLMQRFRPVRNPTAWNNMLLGGGGGSQQQPGDLDSGRPHSLHIQSPNLPNSASTTSGMSSIASDASSDGVSSATSSASMGIPAANGSLNGVHETEQLESLINDAAPIITRRTTSSQKKLRPLRLASSDNVLDVLSSGSATNAGNTNTSTYAHTLQPSTSGIPPPLHSAGSGSSSGSTSGSTSWGLGLY